MAVIFKHIDDGVLFQAFAGAYNALVENKESFSGKWQERLGNDNALEKYKAKQFMGLLEDTVAIVEFDSEL